MGRILSIDYGLKRSGIAVTDPLKIIATGLTTVDTPGLVKFVKQYVAGEDVERIIIGLPLNLDDTPTHATPLVQKFVAVLRRDLPQIPVEEVDERYTSKMASRAMIDMGLSRKRRQDKKLVDEIAATILLQEYLQRDI